MIWNVRPKDAITNRPKVAVKGCRMGTTSISSGFSIVSCRNGFVHLGRYESKARSEYFNKINAASIAGIVATKGKAHGVKRADLVSYRKSAD
jgi:hypothetical protein